jgi:hypothetical protein
MKTKLLQTMILKVIFKQHDDQKKDIRSEISKTPKRQHF